MEDILAIVLIFGGGSIFLLAISPVGKAVADRIRAGGGGPPGEVVERLKESQIAVLEEVDHLRQEMTEVQERLDFAERLLAQHREARNLPEGPSSGL
jgi:DNA-binding ferritin-like protein